MAYVKRLIALQLRRKIDAEAARRRKAATRGRSSNGQGKPQYRGRFEQLRQEALAELGEAAAIYEQYENHHGLGSVHLNYAYLHLDNGDLDHAEASAKTAFRLAEEKHDHILMARSRLLLCMIENARVEEGIGESTEPGSSCPPGPGLRAGSHGAGQTHPEPPTARAYLHLAGPDVLQPFL